MTNEQCLARVARSFPAWGDRSRRDNSPRLCRRCAYGCSRSQAVFRTRKRVSGAGACIEANASYRLVVQGEARLGRYPASELRGSAPWLQIYDDHPGLAEKPQLERVREKQAILVDAVSRSPLALFVGGLPEWNEYFFDFQFLPFPSIYDNDLAALFVAVLAALGLLRVCAPGGDRFRWFVLMANLGIFASVPFLIGGQTRIYAATIGYTGILADLSTRGGQMAVATASLDKTTGRSHTYCKIAVDVIVRIRDAS